MSRRRSDNQHFAIQLNLDSTERYKVWAIIRVFDLNKICRYKPSFYICCSSGGMLQHIQIYRSQELGKKKFYFFPRIASIGKMPLIFRNFTEKNRKSARVPLQAQFLYMLLVLVSTTTYPKFQFVGACRKKSNFLRSNTLDMP